MGGDSSKVSSEGHPRAPRGTTSPTIHRAGTASPAKSSNDSKSGRSSLATRSKSPSEPGDSPAVLECAGGRYYGLYNIGNTCYCNSVLQVLYSLNTFKKHCVQYKLDNSSMLGALAELFWSIDTQKKKVGCIAPKKFIQRLRADNEMFRSADHHDAHEFFNFLINDIAEKVAADSRRSNASSEFGSPANYDEVRTWVHKSFQGRLLYVTRCLCCETITKREEPFFDLSIDIMQNTTLLACIHKFASIELLRLKEKYFCDHCRCLQEAERSIRFASLPPLLTIHLKRFKFVEDKYGGLYERLSYRVAFDTKMVLEGHPYQLVAVVVHIGLNMSHGHYISCIKSNNQWLHFDDNIVSKMSESDLESFFGSSDVSNGRGSKCGYLLFYEHLDSSPVCGNTVPNGTACAVLDDRSTKGGSPPNPTRRTNSKQNGKGQDTKGERGAPDWNGNCRDNCRPSDPLQTEPRYAQ